MIQAKAGTSGGATTVAIPTWVTSTVYAVGTQVIRNYSIFVCISAHTSGTFYVDWLTNNYWVAISDAPGNIKMCGKATAEPGYLLCDGKAVGDASSGADYTGDIYRELYEYIQANFGGTYNWTNHDKINLPDMRGVYPKGAGTTSRTLGKDANGNYYAGILGAYLQDKMQGHKHNETGIDYVSSGSHYYNDRSNPSASASAAACETDTDVPKTDGTNGTPRTDMTTEPQNVSVTFMVKY
jgi:microcystin-dependent protein